MYPASLQLKNAQEARVSINCSPLAYKIKESLLVRLLAIMRKPKDLHTRAQKPVQCTCVAVGRESVLAMLAYAEASLHETSLLCFITGNIMESGLMGIQGGRGGFGLPTGT